MATWSGVVDLTFTRIASGAVTQAERNNKTADLKIGWTKRVHLERDVPPGFTVNYDLGPQGVAHAGFPPCWPDFVTSKSTPIHFNDQDCKWSTLATGDEENRCETAALHELGHAIGLAHATTFAAVMWPAVAAGVDKRALTADDIAGAQLLYP